MGIAIPLPFTTNEAQALKAVAALVMIHKGQIEHLAQKTNDLTARVEELESLVEAMGVHMKAHCVSIETLVNESQEKANGKD